MGSGSHLDDLNPAQREAATFGVPEGGPAAPGPPLLVVAGAGTGKTGTLAHRVAHLVLSGADPRRVLLLTFTRRAAEEMARRAGRICGRALGTDVPLELEWAGTFHAVGARLLRLYAPAIGLDPAFTILDRGDAADLLARPAGRCAGGERLARPCDPLGWLVSGWSCKSPGGRGGRGMRVMSDVTEPARDAHHGRARG